MSNIRTAISIPESLFERVDALAKKANVSRSRVFALAVEDYLRQIENKELLQAINAAYTDSPSAEEEDLYERIKAKQRQLVKGQW